MKKFFILLITLMLFGCGKEETIKIEYDDTYYQVATPYKQAIGSYTIRDYEKEEVESILMNISKTYFKTSNSLYQEGQYLNTEETKQLINEFNETEPIEVNKVSFIPSFITTIYEQDYLTTNNDLKGISLAIVVDNKQYYEIDGKTSYTLVSDEIVLKYGVDKANELVSYLRKKEELKEIKIVVGVFLNSNNSLPGAFKYLGSTDDNTISLDYVNYNYQQLDSSYLMNNDMDTYNNILAIKSSLSGYTNIYINPIGLYKNNELIEVKININKSYFKTSEILNITNIIRDNLSNFGNINIKVYLKSNNKTKAFINKKNNQNSIETYILEE